MITPFTFQVNSEKLSACKVANSNYQQSTILFLHGAGQSNKERALPIAQKLLTKGYSSLLFDFSGHGESTGELVNSSLEKRLYEAESALCYLDPRNPQALVAASMSGHIALELIKRHSSIENVILFCPAMYSQQAFSLPFNGPFSEEIRKSNSWRNRELLEVLSKFGGKLLVIMGENDEVIPRDLPQLLIKTAVHVVKKELITLPNVGHSLIKTIIENENLLDLVTDKMEEFIAS